MTTQDKINEIMNTKSDLTHTEYQELLLKIIFELDAKIEALTYKMNTVLGV